MLRLFSGHDCQTEMECDKIVKGIRDAVGGGVAGSRIDVKKSTHTAGWLGRLFGARDTVSATVSIMGDMASFRALGENASRLADLVGSAEVFTVQIANRYPGSGGGQPVVPGGISVPENNPRNVYLQDDPSAWDKDTSGFIGTGFGTIPGANFAEALAHELFGHTWGNAFGGAPMGTTGNLRQSVLAEDQVRRTDPSRGIKTRHGGTEVITREDLDKLRKK